MVTLEGLAGWWTVQTSGDTSVNGVIHFQFAGFRGTGMKVKEMIPGQKLVWESVSPYGGWTGHLFTFSLDANEGKTRIRFEQSGWAENGDFYASSCFSWARYLESLRQLRQTGRGEAFGSEGYRK